MLAKLAQIRACAALAAPSKRGQRTDAAPAIVRAAARRLPIPIASAGHSLSATGSKHRRPAPFNASGKRSLRPQPTNSRQSVCADSFAG